MKTKKYVKKPVVIEAYQTDEEVIIHTLEGDMKASPGDYIITGVHGEKYPCKPDIFEETYDEVKGMTEKEKLLDCIDNYMDGDGNWYDPYFAIQETFSKDKIEKMTEEEIINLVTLADNIQNELY